MEIDNSEGAEMVGGCTRSPYKESERIRRKDEK
jgi:hypothetical protein